jgi:hypothetical protein
MKIAFTLCSNNYLAQAKILGDSLLDHNPEYQLIIGLVDRKSDEVDYDFFLPHQILPIAEIGIAGFDDIWRKFDIIELNTAVKPSFFKYLFQKYNTPDFLFYFDPDIMILDSLAGLEEEFKVADVLLTPHIMSPIPLDGSWPYENSFLNYGVFNLGFLGLAGHSEITNKLLNWWEERTLTMGFSNVENGIFVDQLWINFAPIYYERVKILKHFGYNAAPWNLHERQVYENANGFVMQDQSSLVFFHFSSYNYKKPEELSKHYFRYNFSNCPGLVPLYKHYHELLIKNNIASLSNIPCYYVTERNKLIALESEKSKPGTGEKIVNVVRSITPPVVFSLIKKVFKPGPVN